MPRRPLIIFVNSLAHFVRAAGWRPDEELLERGEAWVVAVAAAAAGGTLLHGIDDNWEARPPGCCDQCRCRRQSGVGPRVLNKASHAALTATLESQAQQPRSHLSILGSEPIACLVCCTWICYPHAYLWRPARGSRVNLNTT